MDLYNICKTENINADRFAHNDGVKTVVVEKNPLKYYLPEMRNE